MIPRVLAILCAFASVHAAEVVDPYFELRLELGLERPPQRVRDDFTSGGSSAVASGSSTTSIDAQPARAARLLAASGRASPSGGLCWGVGLESVTDRFRIADGVPERGGSQLRMRRLGAMALLGWSCAPIAALEIEATAYAGVGTCHASWISPDVSVGTVAGEGDGGYLAEGARVAVGTRFWRHASARAIVGIAACQAGADIDYDGGDSSRLRLDSLGWLAAVAIGYRF